MMSGNNLLLSISGDEDVNYTAPKTPSYCPSTDIKVHMAEDKQNDAYKDKTSHDITFTTSAFPTFYSSHILAYFQVFVKGYALIHSGKWVGHNFVPKKISSIPRTTPPPK